MRIRDLLLILAAAVGGATAGAAAQECLSGDALADQRALATLRADSEAACPYATYDGTPGRHRGDYRRCAAAVLDAALGGGRLRGECRKTALRGIKGATCGGDRVACGRVHTGPASTPLSCRVKPAAACRDRAAFRAAVCTPETHCDEAVDWMAATALDPRANGPFGVGVRTLTLVKDSVVAPGTPRALATLVWYPTAPSAAPIDPTLAGVVDAPLAAAGAPYPLLLFSHGSCGLASQSTFLTALLASHGYVVAAPPHPGNTLADGSGCAAATALVQSAVERPADVRFVTDQLLAATLQVGAPLFGAIDATRIGMSGHSFGGHTTFKVVAADARFRVAVALAPIVPLVGGQPPVLAVPSLFMLGQIDSVLGGYALTDLDDVRAAYDAAQPPKYLVEIAHAGHYAFANGCFPGPDCAPPATLTQDEAHAVVRRWVLPFLERHRRGDTTAAAFFAAPPTGVLVRQQ